LGPVGLSELSTESELSWDFHFCDEPQGNLDMPHFRMPKEQKDNTPLSTVAIANGF